MLEDARPIIGKAPSGCHRSVVFFTHVPVTPSIMKMLWRAYSAAVIHLALFSFGRCAPGQRSSPDIDLAQSLRPDSASLIRRSPPGVGLGFDPSQAPVDHSAGEGNRDTSAGASAESSGDGSVYYEFRPGEASGVRIRPFDQTNPSLSSPARPARPARRVSNGQCVLGQYQGPQGTPRQLTDVNGLSRQECQSYNWAETRTTEWLVDYWRKRSPDFGSIPGGMVSLLRGEFLGDRMSTCKLFTAETCDFNKCRDERALASVAPCDRDPASNVLLSIQNVQSWFLGTLTAFSQGMQGLSLVKDHLAQTFYIDSRIQDYTQFKQLMTFANIVVGCIGPAAPAIRTVFRAIPGLDRAAALPDTAWFLPPHLFANFQVLFLSNAGSPYGSPLPLYLRAPSPIYSG